MWYKPADFPLKKISNTFGGIFTISSFYNCNFVED